MIILSIRWMFTFLLIRNKFHVRCTQGVQLNIFSLFCWWDWRSWNKQFRNVITKWFLLDRRLLFILQHFCELFEWKILKRPAIELIFYFFTKRFICFSHLYSFFTMLSYCDFRAKHHSHWTQIWLLLFFLLRKMRNF